jgi:hypothetical protein
LELVSLYQDVFIEGIEGLPQTPLHEFRVELNDYSPLIPKPYAVVPILEEIMKRLIQQYVDAGCYIRETSQYVFLLLTLYDTKLEKLIEHFTRNFIQSKEKSMDDIIQELEDHFAFRLVFDFRKLNKGVIPYPYPNHRAKELNRIAKKKVYKTSLDLKYGFDAMGFYRDHSKFIAVITPFGIFIPTRLGFGGSYGSAYMQRLSDYVYVDLEDVCFTLMTS